MQPLFEYAPFNTNRVCSNIYGMILDFYRVEKENQLLGFLMGWINRGNVGIVCILLWMKIIISLYGWGVVQEKTHYLKHFPFGGSFIFLFLKVFQKSKWLRIPELLLTRFSNNRRYALQSSILEHW